MVLQKLLAAVLINTILTASKFSVGLALSAAGNTTSPSSDSSSSSVSTAVRTYPGDHPYVASVRLKAGKNFCAGVLIHKRIVLTVAHCVDFGDPSQVDIGRFNRDGADEGRFKSFDVVETRIHPGYKQGTVPDWDFDIALVVLDGESLVNPAEFARNEDSLRSAAYGLVFGWGRGEDTYLGVDLVDLSRLDVRLTPRDVCTDSFREGLITKQMICGGDQDGAACLFISGSPLFVAGKVAGIVSWGVGRCDGSAPDVYSSVGSMAGWIEDQIQDVNNP